uniref:Cytochrome P450 n=1 Tax=Kalanchoe fedtschenkoi TaxID=63787 RepID=A0A7N0RFE7_KALFE
MSTLAILSATFLSLSLSLSLIWILFRSKITSPLTKWPLVGHFAPLIFSNIEINDYAASLLGLSGHTADLKGPSFTGIEFVLTSDPENIHYICGSNASNYYRGEQYKDVFEIWGDGILVAESQWWNGFMSLVENATNRMLNDGLLPILDRAAELGFWVDMQDLSRRFTLELTCKFLLGIDLDSLSVDLPEVPFSKAIEDMEEAIFYRHLKPLRLWKLQRWLGIGVEGKSTKAKAILDEFVYRFLQDSVVNMLTAGRDTTSVAFAWFFWLVSTHPSIEGKLRQELKEAFHLKEGDKWPYPSYQAMSKLVYLHGALCEALRLYPPAPFNRRTAIGPDTLPSGHRVDKGKEIIISTYTLGRTESVWGADCLEFKPQRWISDKGGIVHVTSNKFNAFSAGANQCLGKELAMLEMKMVAAAVVWNYHFEVVEGHSVDADSSIMYYMKHGLKVHVAKKV